MYNFFKANSLVFIYQEYAPYKKIEHDITIAKFFLLVYQFNILLQAWNSFI